MKKVGEKGKSVLPRDAVIKVEEQCITRWYSKHPLWGG